MSYLIFSTFDVGGLPSLMADILHRAGIPIVYINLSSASGHDSGAYHYGFENKPYDLSYRFKGYNFPSIAYNKNHIIRELIKIRKEYSISRAFATGFESWFVAFAGISYAYWTYGSDVDYYSVYSPYRFSGITDTIICFWDKLKTEYWRLSHDNINKTLRYCDKIFYTPYQKWIIESKIPNKDIFFLPHLLPQISWSEIESMRSSNSALLDGRPFILSTARHVWSKNNRSLSDNKGNDILVKGFVAYLQMSGDQDTQLALIKKGVDHEETARIAEKMGVSDRIEWLEPMPKPELAQLYAAAKAVLGQFSTPALTYASLEPLAYGTPTISSYINSYPVTVPVLNAKNEADIGKNLCTLLSDNGRYEELRRESWNWANTHCTEAAFCNAFINIWT